MQVRLCLKYLNFTKTSLGFCLGKHRERKYIHRKEVGALETARNTTCLLDLSLPSLDIQSDLQMITEIQFLATKKVVF